MSLHCTVVKARPALLSLWCKQVIRELSQGVEGVRSGSGQHPRPGAVHSSAEEAKERVQRKLEWVSIRGHAVSELADLCQDRVARKGPGDCAAL